MSRRKPKPGKRIRGSILVRRSWFVLGGLALVLLYFGAGFILRSTKTALDTAASASKPEEPTSSRDGVLQQVIQQTRHFRGDPDAPVTILEFSDFQ